MSPAIKNGNPSTRAASIGDSEREDVFAWCCQRLYIDHCEKSGSSEDNSGKSVSGMAATPHAVHLARRSKQVLSTCNSDCTRICASAESRYGPLTLVPMPTPDMAAHYGLAIQCSNGRQALINVVSVHGSPATRGHSRLLAKQKLPLVNRNPAVWLVSAWFEGVPQGSHA